MYQKKITFVCRQYVNKQQLRKGKQTLADVTRHQARKAESQCKQASAAADSAAALLITCH